MRRANIQRIS
jgi:hypothetical protein